MPVVKTASMRNGHGEVHANTKSCQGTIHTKGPFALGVGKLMQARQGNTRQAESSQWLSYIDRKLLRLFPKPVCKTVTSNCFGVFFSYCLEISATPHFHSSTTRQNSLLILASMPNAEYYHWHQ